MTNEELVAEARRLENDYGDSYEVMTHMSALADALEASEARVKELEAKLAAVPDAAGVDAVLNRLDELNNYGISYEVYSELHDLVSAIPTAVHDAVTEVLDAHRCDESAERAYKRTIRAEAERDAALEAIERCRGVLASWKSVQASNREQFESGNPGMIVPIDCVGGLSAALDGAPEPESEEEMYQAGCGSWDCRAPECGRA